jgi:hypothetical protein
MMISIAVKKMTHKNAMQLGIKMNLLNLIKSIYETLTANIIFHGKMQSAFSLESNTR